MNTAEDKIIPYSLWIRLDAWFILIFHGVTRFLQDVKRRFLLNDFNKAKSKIQEIIFKSNFL